jgi:hypothetical protein
MDDHDRRYRIAGGVDSDAPALPAAAAEKLKDAAPHTPRGTRFGHHDPPEEVAIDSSATLTAMMLRSSLPTITSVVLNDRDSSLCTRFESRRWIRYKFSRLSQCEALFHDGLYSAVVGRADAGCERKIRTFDAY